MPKPKLTDAELLQVVQYVLHRTKSKHLITLCEEVEARLAPNLTAKDESKARRRAYMRDFMARYRARKKNKAAQAHAS